MQWRIGLHGIALVAAFVVGSAAQQPSGSQPSGSQAGSSQAPVSQFPPGEPPYYGIPQGGIPQTGLPVGVPPGQVPVVPGTAKIPPGAAEKGPQVASSGELIGFNGFDGSGSQTITLVHTGKMQIAVYHIDRSGQIHLRSSRPIDEDFSFSLNLTAPLPSQIRLLGGQVK